MSTEDDIEQHEVERLRRLSEYKISRTLPENAFDDVVKLAIDIFDVPIAFICTTEADCHWVKSSVGIGFAEIPRSISFCDHTHKSEGVMLVTDASKDHRFSQSPMVTGSYNIRFYAGVSLRDTDGFVLGTLVVADTIPRQVADRQLEALQRLASITLDRLELRKAHFQLQEKLTIADDARRNAVAGHDEIRQVLECLPQAIVVMDADNRILLWNKNYEQMFCQVAKFLYLGVQYETMLRKSLELGTYVVGKDAESKVAWLKERLQFHNTEGATSELELDDGRWIRYSQHQTQDGRKICVRTDVTDDKNARSSFRLLFDNNPIPMLIYDQASLSYIDVNDAAVQHYGYTKNQFLTMTLVDMRPPSDRSKVVNYIQKKAGISNGEIDWTHIKADGTEILVNVYSRPIKYYGLDAALVSVIDVTERRKHDAVIQYQAEHDSLTELPNRRFFLEAVDSALSASQKLCSAVVILIDIDDFKSVNDTLGHQVGDLLIVSVAQMLKHYFGDYALVARLGGDEFAILLTHLAEIEEALDVANEMISIFSKPLQVGDRLIQISVSAGVSTSFNEYLVDSSTLLMNADLALYKAKSDGRGVSRVYEPQMSLQLILYRETEQDLRSGLIENQLEVHYQPLVNLDNASETGFEALLRWNHPDKGMIPPSTFIPIAEASGLILPIGKWVLQQACIEAATWLENLSIAVNVAPIQFRSANFVETVENSLKVSGLAPNRLELEITESMFMERSSEILGVLQRLKKMGVSIALDDFGTGFSGLGYLNTFPIDKIKIDRSFVSGLADETKSLELVRAAISIGQGMGLKTLAEGIETKEQLAILKALGCQQGQGYFFSPAMPAFKIASRLKLNKSNPIELAIL